MKKINIKSLTGMVIALALIIVTGCAVEKASKHTKDGQGYCVTEGAFRANWWNYYERGVSCSDGEYWTGAERDLRNALKMRDVDGRRARTYGMHLVDYFPHRDLGVVLYETGRYDEAIKELESSLSTVETSKAQFYLDKARKAAIEKSGGDTSAPEIRLKSPMATNNVIKGTSITLEAEALDDGYVAEATVSGMPVMIPISMKKLDISMKVALNPGPNDIEIVVKDLSGNEKSLKIKVVSDTEGPQVSIVDFTKSKRGARVKVYLYDAGGIDSFEINGEQVDLPVDVKEHTFSADVSLSGGKLAFVAKDMAGNDTSGVYPENETDEGAMPMFVPQLKRWAGPFTPFRSKRARSYFAAPGMIKLAKVIKGPKIKIKDLKDGAKVYFDSIYLEGSAQSPAGVVEMKVGNKTIVKRLGKSVYFNYLTKLKKGENVLVFTARDSAGNLAKKTIKVTRIVPRVHKMGSRFSVSMLPFYLRGDVDLSQVAYGNLVNALVNGKRFRMLDRSKINAAVRELKLAKAGLTDPKATVRVGKLVASEGILVGIVTEKKRSVEVYARLVDTETGQILVEKDAYHQDKSLKNMKLLMDGLGIKIKNSFPLVEGILVKVEKNKLEANFRAKTLKPGMRVILFRPGPSKSKKHGADTLILGEGRIVSVKGGRATVALNKKGLKVRLETDILITK